MQNRTDFVHGWMSADCGRGTTDIVWSCLGTIFLCVWTAIHLPVPPYTHNWQQSWPAKFGRSSVVPAFVSVIAPESLAFVAVMGLLKARRSRAILRRTIDEKMSLAHGFFLDMGGFCLKLPAEKYLQISSNDIERAADASTSLGPAPPPMKEILLYPTGLASDPWKYVEPPVAEHGQDVAMAGQLSSNERAMNSRGGPVLTSSHPSWFHELKLISEEQVNSSAKSDALTKLITCMQALWFATQVISRLCQYHTVTLLEVSTLAYVFCAVTAYAAWWKKPQGCTVPVILQCTEEEKPSHQENLSLKFNVVELWGLWKWIPSYDRELWGLSEWATSFDRGVVRRGEGFALFMVLGALYGAIHVASWNIALPSNPELWLWRASSLYCLVFGLLLNLNHTALFLSEYKMVFIRPGYWLLSITTWVYCIVRVFMLVEVFVSLRSLPSSAYKSVHWSTFVPHI